MSRLRISRGAEADILEIWAYLFAASSPQTADRITAKILRQYETLLQFPNMGKRQPELGDDYRSLPVGRYLIFYRTLPDGIEIGRVLHQSRDVLAAFSIEATDVPPEE